MTTVFGPDLITGTSHSASLPIGDGETTATATVKVDTDSLANPNVRGSIAVECLVPSAGIPLIGGGGDQTSAWNEVPGSRQDLTGGPSAIAPDPIVVPISGDRVRVVIEAAPHASVSIDLELS